MKLHLPTTKSLNQKGFGHVELLVLVVFIAIFAFVGVRVLTQSHADPLLTSTTCQLRGRSWVSNGCTKTCLAGAGSHVVANPYDYCSNALSKISSSVCAANGRKYISVGCARRWQQTNIKGAIQCVSASATYVVANPYDKCTGAVVTTVSGSCTVSFSYTGDSIGSGPAYSYRMDIVVKNTGTKAFTAHMSVDTSGIDTLGKSIAHYTSTTPAFTLASGTIGTSAYRANTVNSDPKVLNVVARNTTAPTFSCTTSYNR